MYQQVVFFALKKFLYLFMPHGVVNVSTNRPIMSSLLVAINVDTKVLF